MQDFVNAYFNGELREMRLRRDLVAAFEHETGGSAFNLLRRLTSGVWTRTDVQIVLEYALISDAAAARMIKLGRAGFMGRLPVHPSAGKSAACAVLDRSPLAPYAVLAARILEAALYGLKPADANFDERQEIGEAA